MVYLESNTSRFNYKTETDRILMHMLPEHKLLVFNLSDTHNEKSRSVVQVSSTTGLNTRWPTCVLVRSRRNRMPPCLWRGRSWMWPGTRQMAFEMVLVNNRVPFGFWSEYHFWCCPQRLAERLQEGHQEGRKRTLLVHSPQWNRPHWWRCNRLRCFWPL